MDALLNSSDQSLASGLQAARNGTAQLPQPLRDALRILAAEAIGEENAIVAATLAERVHLVSGRGSNNSPRALKKLLEVHYAELPIPVAAGSHGYYVPVTDDERRHYARSLLSRIRATMRRLHGYELQLQRVGATNHSRVQALARAANHLEAL